MKLGLIGPDQSHTLFTAGNQNRLDIELFDQGLSLTDKILLGSNRPHHRFKFAHIGRHQIGATILIEIAAFGVHQHGDISLPGLTNPELRIG